MELNLLLSNVPPKWRALATKFLCFAIAIVTSFNGLAQTNYLPTLACNTYTPLTTSGAVPMTIINGLMPGSSSSTNIQPWTGYYGYDVIALPPFETWVAGSVDNAARAINSDQNLYATLDFNAVNVGRVTDPNGLRLTAGISGGHVAASASNPVRINVDIELVAPLEINLLKTLVIKTYNGNSLAEIDTVGSSIINISLLNSTGKKRVSFIATQQFDKIMIEQRLPAGITITDTRIYNIGIERFCNTNTPTCNQNTNLIYPNYSVVVDKNNTGLSGIACVLCGISNLENAAKGDVDNPTSMNFTLAVGAALSYGVRDLLQTHNTNPAEPTFAGFEISSPGILQIGVLEGITVSTSNDGVTWESADGSSGLITAPILTGSSKRIIGFIPTQPFNRIKITLDAAVNILLGTTNIYKPIVKKFCNEAFTCNQMTAVKNPTYPVYINGSRTGVNSLACVGCEITGTENLINGSSDPAIIKILAGVGMEGSISVANALYDYPAGTFVGFDLESANLLSLNLLGKTSIKIELYDELGLVQSSTGNNILAGVNTSLLEGVNREIIGIVSNVSFREARLVIKNLVTAEIGETRIYNFYIQEPCVGVVDCNLTGFLSRTVHGAVINGERTGVQGLAGIVTSIDDPWNTVSDDTDDYARLYSVVNALTSNNLSVATPSYTYPAGSFAGFAVAKNDFLIAANLLEFIKISTYKDGVFVEESTVGSLINLNVLIPILAGKDYFLPGFITTQDFDEVRITVGSILNVFDQFIDVYGAYVNVQCVFNDDPLTQCYTGQLFNDEASGYINSAIYGSLKYNDTYKGGLYHYVGEESIPSGAHYNLVVNEDGTYTFNTDTPGTYVFEFEVCSEELGGCKTNTLTLYISDPSLATNAPIAFNDYAFTFINNEVELSVLLNDVNGNPLNQISVQSIAVAPTHGTLINNGDGTLTYIPAENYIGLDEFQYTIVESGSGLTSTATVYLFVKPGDAANNTLANNDVVRMPPNSSVSGNVLENDKDPENDNLAVLELDLNGDGVFEAFPTGSLQDVMSNGVKSGQIIIYPNGDYEFFPEENFTGSITIGIMITDDNAVPARSGSSLIINVAPVPDLTPTIVLWFNNFNVGQSRNLAIEFHELKSLPTTEGTIQFTLTVPIGYELTFEPAATEIELPVSGNLNIQNANWSAEYDSVIPERKVTLTAKSGIKIDANSMSRLGFSVKRVGGENKQSPSIEVFIHNQPTQYYDMNTHNNFFYRIINSL